MKPPYTPADYRGRDQITLEDFIADVEACHFRSGFDTGANPNALFIWNIVRNWAGMDSLEQDDLIMNQAMSDGVPFEEMKEQHRLTREFLDKQRTLS